MYVYVCVYDIKTLQQALCWTTDPQNLNVSMYVLAKMNLGGWLYCPLEPKHLSSH